MNIDMTQPKRISSNITYHEDGKYRWTYEFSLFKNPTFILLILEIVFFIFLGVFALVMILGAMENSDFFREQLPGLLKIFGFILLGVLGATALGYLIYAAIMGGKYSVFFEMDEKGITHKQEARQAKKARGIGTAAAITGLATGNFGMAGAGLASQRTDIYSDFSKVKKVRAYPKRNLIKVNATLNHNQVYAAEEDFEFVKNFIESHCPNLK